VQHRFRHRPGGSLAYVGIGSNLTHPRRHVARAIAEMARLPRTRVAAVSPNYVSAPLGTSGPQPDYVNAVAALVTSLAAPALLKRMRAIEQRHGRPPTEQRLRNAARTLDLDLLLFGHRRLRQRQLTLPHPRMHQRAFVLRPLLDIAPAAVIPGRGAARHWLRRVHGQRIARTRRHTRL
jgi:2-amino-4-hydroxy-6-hydroxymethyldihydropteridine diphosphokinase